MSVRFLSGVNVDQNTLFVDDVNNRVGIGTSQPSTNLNVVVDPNGGYHHTYSKIHLKAGTQASISIGSPNNGSAWYMFGDTDDSYVAGMAYEHAVDAMYFNVNNSTAVYINSSRNVGIGTTAPSAKLDIYGDSNSADNMIELINSKYDSTDTSGETGILFGWNNHVAARITAFKEGTVNRTGFQIIGEAGFNVPTTIATFRSTGRVGIGTTNPLYPLDVQSGGAGTVLRAGTSFISIDPAGSASAPSLIFNGDDNTGIWRPAADTLAVSTAGAERMRITSAGNVGIGTTSPAQKLDVAGGDIILSSNATYIRSKDASGNIPRMFGINSSSDTYIGPIDPYAGGSVFYGVSANVSAQTFYTGASARLHINSAGNVGIGTTSPQSKVQISYESDHTTGDISVNKSALDLYNTLASDTDEKGSIITFSDNYFDGNYQKTTRAAIKGGTDQTGNTAAGFLAFYTDSSSANSATERMRITSAGNVGIGTTAPDQKLVVSGNIRIPQNNYLYFDNTAHYIRRGASDVEIQGFNGLQLRTNDSTRVYINQSGNVGIGTTSPAVRLDYGASLNQAFHLYTSGVDYYGINMTQYDSGPYSTNIFSGDGGQIKFRTATGTTTQSTRMTITQSGNVGIGTTSPAQKLDVVGSAQVSGQFAQGVNVADKIANYGAEFRSSSASAQIFFGRSDTSVGSGAIGADASYVFSVWSVPSFSRPFVITQGGNVGIGTTSPSQKLHVVSSEQCPALFESTTAGGGIALMDSTTTNDAQVGIGAFGNDLCFRSGGSAAGNMRLLANGNLGIGTTNPLAQLDISSGTTSILRLSNSDTQLSDGQLTGLIEFYQNDSSSGGTGISGRIGMRSAPRPDNGIYFGTVADMSFFVSGQGDGAASDNATKEALTIRAGNGNVGIGTTNPGRKLHVDNASGVGEAVISGTTGATLYFRPNALYSTAGNFGIFTTGLTSGTYESTMTIKGYSSAVTDVMTIKGSGNVGIGTTSPSSKLEVSTAGLDGITLSRTAQNAGSVIYSRSYDTSNVLRYSNRILFGATAGVGSANGFIAFETANANTLSERMRITSAGNVGIGTTAPSEKLTVAGKILSRYGSSTNHSVIEHRDTSDNVIFSFRRSDGAGGNGNDLVIRAYEDIHLAPNNSDDSKLVVKASGNVGIGTTSPSHTLDVNGELRVGTVVPQTSADFSVRRNGANIEFGHGNRTSGYYGTIGVQGNNGMPYIAFSADCESSVNTFTTRGFKGNVIHTDSAGNFMFSQLTTANATGQSLTERMRITAAGNVGIGTTAPVGLIDITGSVGSTYVSSAGNNINFTRNAANYISALGGSSSFIVFTTGGTEVTQPNDAVMTLSATRNVGIGNTAPSQKLHVTGNVRVTGAYYDSNNSAGSSGQVLSSTGSGTDWVSLSEISGVDGTGTANYVAKWSDADTITNSQIQDNGTTVGIGVAPGSAKLTVNGAIAGAGKTRYGKDYPGGLNTTGVAVAGLPASFNGDSAIFEFTCSGGTGAYQRVVYSCWNAAGIWNTSKVIDEGTNGVDVVASANASTITFTFKSRSGTLAYTPKVRVEVSGTLDTSYL